MKIWLDLANSPQVLFFRPILTELQQRGHIVEVTTRTYAQTVQLADILGFHHTAIGQHGGRSSWGIARQISLRALVLAQWARQRRFDLALSHNSYSQAVAAAVLRIPLVTLMDYEHQPLNHLCFRLARRVIVPDAFPQDSLHRYGADNKTITYSGVKEQVYLADFEPQTDYLQKENLPEDRPLVIIRPPAPWTAYSHFENDLFDSVLACLSSHPEYYLLFLPRIAYQSKSVHGIANLHVSTRVYDGPNLVFNAALVISGGGTMNREGAVLGTPTFTIFKGKLGAVDRYLIEKSRMVQLHACDDLDQIHSAVTKGHLPRMAGHVLVSQIADQILSGF